MAWSRILGHDAEVERFRHSLARGRLPHAYLFVGPPGVGKELFARELAKALLCSEDHGEACDRCRSCLKVEHGNHPDVTVVRRIERTDKGERRTQIVIDQVREEVQEPIALKPFEGRYKIFVLDEADRMTEEAQNCLLKTLEEPPPHSLLILIAARTEPFVDTVISRCQVVRFRPLAAGLVERILVEQHGMEAGTARTLARLSGGSPGRALRYVEGGAYETSLWLLRELATMPVGAEFAVAEQLFGKAKESKDTLEDARDRLRPVLDLLTLAWRDIFFRASGHADELLAWGKDCSEWVAVGEGMPASRARRLAEIWIEARDNLDANANIKLLLEKTLLDTHAVLRGREPIIVR